MLTPWNKSYDQPRQHIKKQRHYFANKGPSSQCYGLSSSHVWMWELDYKESWVRKNWCFWTVVLEKTLESPLDCKEIKPVNPAYSLEGLMLKLNLQYFGHLMWRTDSLEKTLMLGKIDGRRRRGWQGWDGWMASPTQWTWVCVNSRSWWWTGKPGVLHFIGSQRIGHDWVTELNWIELCQCCLCYYLVLLAILWYVFYYFHFLMSDRTTGPNFLSLFVNLPNCFTSIKPRSFI